MLQAQGRTADAVAAYREALALAHALSASPPSALASTPASPLPALSPAAASVIRISRALARLLQGVAAPGAEAVALLEEAWQREAGAAPQWVLAQGGAAGGPP